MLIKTKLQPWTYGHTRNRHTEAQAPLSMEREKNVSDLTCTIKALVLSLKLETISLILKGKAKGQQISSNSPQF